MIGSHLLSFLWNEFVEDTFLTRVGSVVKDEGERRRRYSDKRGGGGGGGDRRNEREGE